MLVLILLNWKSQSMWSSNHTFSNLFQQQYLHKADCKTCFPKHVRLTKLSFPLSAVSPDVSPGLTIWLFTWRGTSRVRSAPTKQHSDGKSFKRKKQKKRNKCRLPTSLLVELSQTRVAEVCSSQSMLFCTILKPSACETSLWRKAL